MDCNKFEGSQKLNNLAEQLRLYKPPTKYSTNNKITNPIEDDKISNASQHGNAKSNNRAAVLICLFEGIDGDVRVILTKRSSTLSSHSGEKKALKRSI